MAHLLRAQGADRHRGGADQGARDESGELRARRVTGTASLGSSDRTEAAWYRDATCSGAAIYITLVEHPARLECGTALATTEFGPSYRRATLMQVPFTLVAILPTNKRLLDPGLDRGSAEATALLERWGRLHAVRSVASGVAFALLACHLGGLRC